MRKRPLTPSLTIIYIHTLHIHIICICICKIIFNLKKHFSKQKSWSDGDLGRSFSNTTNPFFRFWIFFILCLFVSREKFWENIPKLKLLAAFTHGWANLFATVVYLLVLIWFWLPIALILIANFRFYRSRVFSPFVGLMWILTNYSVLWFGFCFVCLLDMIAVLKLRFWGFPEIGFFNLGFCYVVLKFCGRIDLEQYVWEMILSWTVNCCNFV